MNLNQLISTIEPYVPNLFQNLEYLLRIFVAMVLGILIGNERKNRNKSAGTRTHALVALGSALMMVVSKYGFYDSVQGDGARLAAQVVSGVGFLGAGMIFVRHNLVSGLTTAAGVWTTAGIGLTIGSGMYFVGIFSAVMLVLMQNISHKIPFFSNVPASGLIRMTVLNRPGIVEELEQYVSGFRVEIQSIQINKTEKDKIKLELDVIYPHKLDKSKLLYALAEREDVVFLAE
jgi:putative Mg2+ transporter-C (MgtC) family protein